MCEQITLILERNKNNNKYTSQWFLFAGSLVMVMLEQKICTSKNTQKFEKMLKVDILSSFGFRQSFWYLWLCTRRDLFISEEFRGVGGDGRDTPTDSRSKHFRYFLGIENRLGYPQSAPTAQKSAETRIIILPSTWSQTPKTLSDSKRG